MNNNLRGTRIATGAIIAAAVIVAIGAVVDRDWTLLLWVGIAATNAGMLYSYIKLTQEQAEVIREQGDLIDRWTAMTTRIVRGLSDD